VTFAVALVVVVLALGSLEYYTYETMNSQLSDTKTDLNAQIAGLQSTITSLRNTVTSLNKTLTSLQGTVAQNQQTENALDQQITTLRIDLQNLQNSVSSLSLWVNSTVITQLQSVTQSINAIQTRLSVLFPEVPNTTLIITNGVYNSGNATFIFTVRNTQNYTVYAQLSVTLEDPCNNGFWWYYTSQIFTFTPLGTLSVPLNLVLSIPSPNYSPSCTSINEAVVLFIIPQSTAISSTYDFTISPPYNHP
jgi:cell division protein FtsB